MQEVAQHILKMTRIFNVREGLTFEQDSLPERLHKQVLPEGGSLPEEEMEYMLRDYYRLRGWSKEGIPVN